MGKYFDKFNTVIYSGHNVTDITARVVLENISEENLTAFYNRTVKEGERFDQISYDYYDHSDYTWLMYLSNGIIDPYYGEPLSDQDLRKFVVDKYGSIQAAQTTVLYKVVNWDTDDRQLDTASFDALPDYLKKYWSGVVVGTGQPAAYIRKRVDWKATSVSVNEASYWKDYTAWDYETDLNEKKRDISIVVKGQHRNVELQLKDLLNK